MLTGSQKTSRLSGTSVAAERITVRSWAAWSATLGSPYVELLTGSSVSMERSPKLPSSALVRSPLSICRPAAFVNSDVADGGTQSATISSVGQRARTACRWLGRYQRSALP